MSSIKVKELKARLDAGDDIQLIDIREEHEVDSGKICDKHIPMADIMNRIDDLRMDVPVIIYCKSGSRAEAIVHVLQTEKNMDNAIYLEGGIEAWSSEIDPSIIVY